MFKLLKKWTRKNAMTQVTPDEWRKKNHSCLTCEYYNQEETISKEEAVVLNGRQMTVILNGMLMNICLYSKELIEHILII